MEPRLRSRQSLGTGSRCGIYNSPTLTVGISGAGVILGTAGYMAPEQVRGHAVDKRADIWSFGVVLYEMLTGRRLFVGDTISDSLTSVLKADPDWKLLPAGTPASIRRLLHRCLERDRKRRLRDIGDASRTSMKDSRSLFGNEAPRQVPLSSRRWIAATAVLALIAAARWFRAFYRRPRVEAQVLRLQLEPPPGGLNGERRQ